MSETIRILHVLDKISVDSGVSSVVMNYYGKLDQSRIIFDFMVNEDVDTDTRAYIEGNGSKIFVMPRLKFRNTFKYIKALKEFYNSHEYKIIHGHVANSAVFYLGLAKNVPYRIIHSHNTRAADVCWKRGRNWVLSRFISAVANRYMACSDEAAEFLFGKRHDALVLNNAIDIEKFVFSEEKRSAIRSSLGLKDEFVIGHVGRFAAQKNHIFLIDIFAGICKENDNARLLLVGDGELYADIAERVNRLGLESIVLFVGARSDVDKYMSAMDIFVLPSLFEGLGLVGVEAQTAGLRVLASENIPRAMDITGSVDFLKLNKGIWIQAIINSRIIFDRLEQGDKVRGGRFDIETQAGVLCEYYEGLLSDAV